MRPYAEAVGLICILAHDYSIVKIKMLFRYPVTVVDYQLSVDTAPILTASCPFFSDILHSQIQHFEKTVIGRKYGLCLSHFLQLAVKALYGVGGIDQLTQIFGQSLEINIYHLEIIFHTSCIHFLYSSI